MPFSSFETIEQLFKTL